MYYSHWLGAIWLTTAIMLVILGLPILVVWANQACSRGLPVGVFDWNDFLLGDVILVRRIVIFLAECHRYVTSDCVLLASTIDIVHADCGIPSNCGFGNLGAWNSRGLQNQGRESLLMICLKQKLLHHKLRVGLESLIDVLEQEVVVWECRVCWFHEILTVLLINLLDQILPLGLKSGKWP